MDKKGFTDLTESSKSSASIAQSSKSVSYTHLDNNAIRITCQEVFVDFSIYIKYDMLINTKKAMKGVFILSHGALRKENQFLRREHTDHKETQRNETTGTGGQNRYQYAEPF